MFYNKEISQSINDWIFKGSLAKTVLPFFVLILLLPFNGLAFASTSYVNGSCANNGDGSSSTCAAAAGGNGAYNSIQAAVDKVTGGSVVKIVPYSYSYPDSRVATSYNENLVITKEITLETDTSVINPADLPSSSWLVINGDADNDGIGDNGHATIAWNAGVGGTLQGLTVTGGHSGIDGGMGAGIMIAGEGTDVLVQNLRVIECTHGIVVRYGAAPTIKSCIIFNNEKSAIVVRDGSAPIIGGGNCGNEPKVCNDPEANIIYRNSMQMDSTECFASGGYSDCEQERVSGCAAIAVLDASSPNIWGNMIYGNKYSGIAAMGQSTPSIKSNRIYFNGRVGISLSSIGQGIEVVSNWIQNNERGLGIQSSGDPCNKISIRDNNILGNSYGGISSCNAYIEIGGASEGGGQTYGNRIWNNTGDGVFIALGSEADISYNNILNNSFSGIVLFGSKATIENNLVSDNGKGQNTNKFGHIELVAGVAEKINNNIIVGGNKSEAGFNGIGIFARETVVFPDTPSTLKEVRDNIIYRVDMGVKLEGPYTEIAYRPGAVDRNLVMQWSDSDADGYVLNTASPGDQTYYYGQAAGSYGNPASYFFDDPDHENDSLHPDFMLSTDPNSPVYTISAYANDPPVEYLGLPSNFKYRDDTEHFKYKFYLTVQDLEPSLDSSAPTIARVVPPDGANGVSANQVITVTLQDVGDGIDGSSVQMDLDGGAGASGNCTNCLLTFSGDSSNLKVRHAPSVALDSATTYTITINADDKRSNHLTGTSVFATNGGEALLPYVEDLSPSNGASGVAANTAIQFKLRDDGSGIDPETITLEVDSGSVTPEKNALTDGSGVTPDYLVYYKPPSSFTAGASVDLHIYAEDFDNNFIDTNSAFSIAANVNPPEDVSKLKAQVKGARSIKLSWIPSENTECDIADFPYTLYIDSGNGYDSGQSLIGVAYNVDNYTLSNLSEGTYIFKLTVKDTEGNESVGAVVSNVTLATSVDFADDFDGFRDDFSADLSKWSSSGPATWQIVAGELQVSGAASELTMVNMSRNDYSYRMKVKITAGVMDQDAAWILVRKTAGSGVGTSGYAARIGLGSSGNLGIYELSQTETSLIDTTSGEVLLNTWYNVRLEVEANVIKLYLDDNLKLTVTDSNYSYWDGQIGLWQPEVTNATVSFDDVEVDYNKSDGGLYQYSISENSWIHTISTGTLYTGDSTSVRELLINPLNLSDNFLYRIKFNISSGSAGLLVRKTINSPVASSGYLVQTEPGTTGNIKLYALPNTLLASGDYTVSTGQDYWIWLVERDGNYTVYLGPSSDFSLSTQVLSHADNTFSDNATAGLYAFASSQVNYDDLTVSEDLSESGIQIEINATPSLSDSEYSIIQDAIDTAQVGDTVIFSSGTYRLGDNTIRMKEGVSLKTKTVNACGSKTVTIIGENHLIKAVNGATIEGFRLEGSATNVGIWVMDASPVITNNEILSCYDGIRVGGGATQQGILSAPHIIANCIHDNSRVGISNAFESTAIIENNQIYENATHGIGDQNQASPLIIGNRIHDNIGAGIGNRGQSFAIITQENLLYSNVKQGIGIRGSASPRIENNYVYNNWYDGIGVGCDEGDDPTCISDAHPTIQNNVIYSNLKSGIALRAQVTPLIASNEIYDHIYTCIGVDCEDSDHSFGAGIRISEDSQPILGANNIHDNSYGISMNLNSTNAYTISGLSVTSNVIGMHIGGESVVTVENCTLYSNYKFGIGMYGNAHPTIQNNQIRNNGDAAGRGGENIRIMPAAGTGVGGIGIGLSAYPTITGNNVIVGHIANILVSDDTLGTPQPPDLNKVKLGTAASTENDYYKNRSLYLLDGNGTPQVLLITAYVGGTKEATLAQDFSNKPAEGDRYRIFRENFGIGVRGNTRTGGNVPKIFGNQIYNNFMGVAVGSRDHYNHSPNPEIYSNNIYANGISGCPADMENTVGCGGGIGNRATSAADIHDNAIYSNNNFNNFGVGVTEAATPNIHDNIIYSNYRGIGLHSVSGDVLITSNTTRDNYRAGIEVRDAASTITVRNNYIGNNAVVGLGAIDVTTLSVSDNTVYSNGSGTQADVVNYVTPDAGIRFRSVASATLSGNTVRNNNGFGIAMTGGINADTVNLTGNTVGGAGQGNKLTGIGVGKYNDGSIPNEVNVTMTGNTVSYNGPDVQDPDGVMQAGGIGFYRFAGVANLDNNTVEFNRADGPAAGGIGIRELNGGTINIGLTTGNQIRANLGGPKADYRRCGGIGGRYGSGTINIANNNVYDHNLAVSGASQGGIGFDDNDFSGGGLTVGPDNTIHHNDIGLRMQDVINANIHDNQIYSNGDGTETLPPDGGIRLISCSSIIIDSNDILDNDGFGMALADNTLGQTVTITDNNIGTAGKPNTLGGISVGTFFLAENLGTYTIDSNYISYNDRSGISYIEVDSVDITDNTIVSNGMADYIDPATQLWNASGIRAKDCQIASITGNILRNNKFAGFSSYSSPGYIGPPEGSGLPANQITNNGNSDGQGFGGGGEPIEECPDVGNGPGSGDGGIAVRGLAVTDTLIVSGNVIADNNLGSVTRKDCDGTVRLDGQTVSCGSYGNGYWDLTQAKVYIDSGGIYVNGVSTPRTSNLVLDCENDIIFSDLRASRGGVSGGEVWGIAIVGQAQGVVIQNCTIVSNQLLTNPYGPMGMSVGGGLLVGPNVVAEVKNNTVRNNGAELPPGAAQMTIDGDTSTDWRTYHDGVDVHWIGFDLDGSQNVTQMRMFTSGTSSRTWDVYVSTSTYWGETSNPPESDKVLSGWIVGDEGTDYWDYSASFPVKAGSFIKMVATTGENIADRHFLEINYNNGTAWATPFDIYGACSQLFGGNSGIAMRCTGNSTIHDNVIESNMNHGIEGRGAMGTIGPNNIVRKHNQGTQFAIAFKDLTDVTITSNEVYDNLDGGIGLNTVDGTVLIEKNKVHHNSKDPNAKVYPGIGIGGGTNGDSTVTVTDNQLWSQTYQNFGIEKSPELYNLVINVTNNTIAGGWNGFRIRYLDNATVNLTGNTVSGLDRWGVMMNDNGGTGAGQTTLNFVNNNISNNGRSGIKAEYFTNANMTLDNNDLSGNGKLGGTKAGQINGFEFQYFDACDVTINSNDLRDNNMVGVRFRYCTATDVTITSNIVTDNDYQGMQFEYNTSGGTVTIRNNNISNNNYVGLEFKNNELTDTIIYSDIIDGNSAGDSWGGVWFQNSDNVSIEKCYVRNNTGIGLRFQDSDNIFIGWQGWDPLNKTDASNPSPGDPYCYPYPVGDPLYAEGTVPDCRYGSNARAYNSSSPCGTTFFDPALAHTWVASELWNSDTYTRTDGTGTTLLTGNSSWAIQIRADNKNVSNVEFRGAVVAGNGGAGFGFISDNGYTLNAKVDGCVITGNTGGDGIQAKEVCTSGCGTTVVDVWNNKVTGSDSVEARDGGHLNIYNGNLFTIVLRVWSGSAEVYNYNYIGCINTCSGGGGSGKGAATYDMHHYNCIGGHVPFDNDYMDIYDHNWFDAGTPFEMHEGGGMSMWNGNWIRGGNIRKNHSGPFNIGDGNTTEPNYFPNGIDINPIDGGGGNSLNGNYCGGSGCWVANAGGRPLPSEICNYGSGGGADTCYGNLDWAAPCGGSDPRCTYWSGPNSWTSFCADRNCTAPDASPYW